MKIVVAVHGAPTRSKAPRTTLNFLRAALAAGHDIPAVFFYHEGVATGRRVENPSSTSAALLAGWIDLKRSFCVQLLVCIGAAETRSVYDGVQASRLDKKENLDPNFELVGLGQLTELIASADRFVTFAA